MKGKVHGEDGRLRERVFNVRLFRTYNERKIGLNEEQEYTSSKVWSVNIYGWEDEVGEFFSPSYFLTCSLFLPSLPLSFPPFLPGLLVSSHDFFRKDNLKFCLTYWYRLLHGIRKDLRNIIFSTNNDLHKIRVF